MKIYTRKGDKGNTSLIGGTRVPKSHLRIEAYGTVDELNSWIGLLKDQDVKGSEVKLLKKIQDELFTIGSLLAADPKKNKMKLPEISNAEIETLEKSIDAMEAKLKPLKNFILPGGLEANSIAHITRCICRRAERATVAVSEHEPVSDLILSYLNRLSDWLFVYARHLSNSNKAKEIEWHPSAPKR